MMTFLRIKNYRFFQWIILITGILGIGILSGCSFINTTFYARPMIVQLIHNNQGNQILAIQESVFYKKPYLESMFYSKADCTSSLQTGIGWAFIINATQSSLSSTPSPMVNSQFMQYQYIAGLLMKKKQLGLWNDKNFYLVGCSTEKHIIGFNKKHIPYPVYHIVIKKHKIQNTQGYASMEACTKHYKETECYNYDDHPINYVKYATNLFQQHQPFYKFVIIKKTKTPIAFIENKSFYEGTQTECNQKLLKKKTSLHGFTTQSFCISKMDFSLSSKERSEKQIGSKDFKLTYINSNPYKYFYIRVQDSRIVQLIKYKTYSLCIQQHTKDSCFTWIKKQSDLQSALQS